MHTLIVVTFVVGYLLIALEGTTHINKSGIALLMSVLCWTFFVVAAGGCCEAFASHVAETCETILFLMGAMAIVEVLDRNGCFNFLIYKLHARSQKALLWKAMLLTFFLSAVLDNMTTTILMLMMLRHLIPDQKLRLLFAGIVVLAANAGGAFSPIGDVTTIMLWINGNVSTVGILKSLFLPSFVSILLPTLLVSHVLKKEHGEITLPENVLQPQTSRRAKIIGTIGILGLVLVPFFRSATGLPPFLGIMGVLALLWIVSEMIISRTKSLQLQEDVRVAEIIKRIDISTILFFLGILLSVGTLKEIGTLQSMGFWLDENIGNEYAVSGLIGILSSVVDNVPLVAGCMSMYNIEPAGVCEALQTYCQDGIFWQLLAYCAGTGGSLLIIGSAAGVVAMGLEKISFGWYLRHFTLIALAGYLAGLFTFFIIQII